MIYQLGDKARAAEYTALFKKTFSDSEGAEEGCTVSELAKSVLDKTEDQDLYIFEAQNGLILSGCVMFTRLSYPNETATVFMLSPVAVKTELQGQRIGQNLIQFGLDLLTQRGVTIATTYGDPAYYGKFGFEQVTTDQVPAPMPLSQPIGWLARSLTPAPLGELAAPCSCVSAFNDPAVW